MRRFVVLSVALLGCGGDLPGGGTSAPPCPNQFLSYGGRCGDEASAEQYLHTMTNAWPTFDDWKRDHCFNPTDEQLLLEYENTQPLALGRGVHMARCGGHIAAYVDNFGSAGQAISQGVHAIEAGESAIAVAMDYRPDDGAREPNGAVQFYVYVNNAPANGLPFDFEGTKFSPFACTVCHGGRLDPLTGLVRGASFLPLQEEGIYFPYAVTPEVQETLRAMNALVYEASPTSAPGQGVKMLIEAAYPSGVGTKGSTYQKGAIPPSWQSDADRYLALVGPYCVSCHAAHEGVPFNSPGELPAERVEAFACGKSAPMPQAEQLRRALNQDANAIGLVCPKGSP